MDYGPTKKSVSKHEVPEWYHDAKFGIFIHWGLYSVPAFAPVRDKDYVEIMATEGLAGHMRSNPYAEWYLNSMRIPGTETKKYQEETYGKDFKYDDFIPEFNQAIKKWNPEDMVNIFKKAGAQYVVLVTKHHDGYLLWSSKYDNPRKPKYRADRDIVGELTSEVKKQGMRMGFYYSGILDWSFNEIPITSIATYLNNNTDDQEYIDYATNHWKELIDKYEPSIVWNDIGYPAGANIYEIFAYYYNKFPDGVINDRWVQFPKWTKKAIRIGFIEKIINWLVKIYMKRKGAVFPTPKFHCDYLTPEYTSFSEIKKKKWETTRGIGDSFGYNKFEPDEKYLTFTELVHMFVDIVSKNGNLLLNVGPMADGTIPDIQKNLLLEFGKWLEVNGDAIFGTKPWVRAEGYTKDGVEIRFTKKDGDLYFILLGELSDKIIIESFKVGNGCTIKLLCDEKNLDWTMEGDDLVFSLPELKDEAPAHAFKITGFIKQ
ncbi:MAG: alpha-L-fucosidase [Candidatus Hodarchaeota archaeon]